MDNNEKIFIASLGGQPQIVTFALDALIEQGEQIGAVHLIYLKPKSKRLQDALDILLNTLRSEKRYAHITLHKHLIRVRNTTLTDITQSPDAALAWESINQLITRLKRSGHPIHMVVSGGRRIIGMLMMSAAAVHFFPNDKLWHMFTPDDIQAKVHDGKMMRLPPNSGFELIELPILPLGTLFQGLRDISHFNQNRAFLDKQSEEKCLRVLEQLTPRRREVLKLFSRGLSPQEVATELHLTLNTINSHKTAIFGLCREVWELEHNKRLTYHFLADSFKGFF